MPRLLNVFDRAGQVSIAVPEGFDLHGGIYQWENDKPGTRLYPLEPTVGADRSTSFGASVSRTISHVDLAWRPIRADLRVQATTDIALDDRQGRSDPTVALHLRRSAAAKTAVARPGNCGRFSRQLRALWKATARAIGSSTYPPTRQRDNANAYLLVPSIPKRRRIDTARDPSALAGWGHFV